MIATATAASLGASELVSLYRSSIWKVFQDRGILSNLRALFSPRYDNEGIIRLVSDIVGSASMNQAVIPYMVTAYNATTRRPEFFKSWDERYEHIPMAAAAVASAAAPTYFSSIRIGESEYIDGGVFAPNPTLCLLIEALNLWPHEDFVVLSLGTGVTSSPPLDTKDAGTLKWATQAPGALLDGSWEVTDYQLRHLSLSMPGRIHYYRVDVGIPRDIKMDTTSKDDIAYLENAANWSLAKDPNLKQFLETIDVQGQ